jgi:hypothetical protein
MSVCGNITENTNLLICNEKKCKVLIVYQEINNKNDKCIAIEHIN